MKKWFFGELKRFDNPMFWISGVSQLLIVIQICLAVFGKDQLLTQVLQNKIMDAVEAVVAFLSTIGVFTTPVPLRPIEPIVSPTEPVAPVKEEESVVPSEPVQPESENK